MLAGRHALVMDFGVAKARAAATGDATGRDAHDPRPRHRHPGIHVPRAGGGSSTVDPRADLYAVGVMAYEMLSGAPRSPEYAAGGARRPRHPAPPPLDHVGPTYRPRCRQHHALPGEGPGAAVAVGRRAAGASGPFATPGQRWQRRLGVDQTPMAGRSPALIAAGLLLAAVLGAALARVRAATPGTALGAGGRHPPAPGPGGAGPLGAGIRPGPGVDALLPGDSLFNALRPRFARRVNIRTKPPGARVWRRITQAPDSTWTLLGTTPLDSALLPLSGGGALAYTTACGSNCRISHARPGGRAPPIRMALDPSRCASGRDGAGWRRPARCLLPGLRARQADPRWAISSWTATRSPTASSSGSWTVAGTAAGSSGTGSRSSRTVGRIRGSRRWR